MQLSLPSFGLFDGDSTYRALQKTFEPPNFRQKVAPTECCILWVKYAYFHNPFSMLLLAALAQLTPNSEKINTAVLCVIE
jgi:hypothetical protein